MLTLKVSKKQQVVHCRLLGALHGDTQQFDFSIPCCRWHLLCWCLSRVFSPCVSPAREVEEAEHTVLRHYENQHWSLTTTSPHSSGTMEVKRKQPRATYEDTLIWRVNAASKWTGPYRHYLKSCTVNTRLDNVKLEDVGHAKMLHCVNSYFKGLCYF